MTVDSGHYCVTIYHINKVSVKESSEPHNVTGVLGILQFRVPNLNLMNNIRSFALSHSLFLTFSCTSYTAFLTLSAHGGLS